jgi:hypothetical protein
MPRYRRGFDTDEAYDYLAKRDRKLGAWMKRIGTIAPDPRWRKAFDPVDALARAILYQQLSGKAAATIVGRVETAIASDRFHCDTLARCDDATIRACGVSGNKRYRPLDGGDDADVPSWASRCTAGRRSRRAQRRADRGQSRRHADAESLGRARRALGPVSHLCEFVSVAHRRFRRAGEDPDQTLAGRIEIEGVSDAAVRR